MTRFEVVLWDVGNVLLHWDPRNLYRTIFDDEDEMERFLATVWTPAENLRCDAGELFASVIDETVRRHPGHEAQIRAFGERWIETIAGPVEGSEQLVEELHHAGVRQLALTNFSAETFPLVSHHRHFALLDGAVVSGEFGVVKPDPEIFEIALDRAGTSADRAVFLDDSPANVAGAIAVGIDAFVFVDIPHARRELAARGLPVQPAVTGGAPTDTPGH